MPQVSGGSPDIDGFSYHSRRPNQIDTGLNFVERMHARIEIVNQSAEDGLIRRLYHPRRGWIISVGNRVEYRVKRFRSFDEGQIRLTSLSPQLLGMVDPALVNRLPSSSAVRQQRRAESSQHTDTGAQHSCQPLIHGPHDAQVGAATLWLSGYCLVG